MSLRCPKCGDSESLATDDLIPGLALCEIENNGEIEYLGETKVHWDGQEVQTDEDGNAQVWCRACSTLLVLINKEGVHQLKEATVKERPDDEAYKRDQEDQRRIDAFRKEVKEFLDSPPPRLLGHKVMSTLTDAEIKLRKESDHITAVWD